MQFSDGNMFIFSCLGAIAVVLIILCYIIYSVILFTKKLEIVNISIVTLYQHSWC